MKDSAHRRKANLTQGDLSSIHKLILILVPILLCGVPGLMTHFARTSWQTRRLTETVDGWKVVYHLSDEQAHRILEIEHKYHGNGSPFSLRKPPSEEEKRRHYEEIGKAMSPEDGARFMRDKSQGSLNHLDLR